MLGSWIPLVGYLSVRRGPGRASSSSIQANSKVDVVYTCDRRSIDVREAYDVIERARRVSSTGFSLHCTLDGRSTGLVELGPEERAGVLRYLETHSSSERVALGLANSHWVVGALAWEDDVSALRVARGETSSVQRQASRSVDSFLGCVMRRRRRQLVGLARAISDVGLVATVEVVVDPDLHGLGIGSGLTAQLTRQISSTGYEIYDIGAMVPPQAQCFFRSCGFTRDREGSVSMILNLSRLPKCTKRRASAQNGLADVLARDIDTVLRSK